MAGGAGRPVGDELAPETPPVELEPQAAASSETAAEAAVIVSKRDIRCTCVLLSCCVFRIGR